MEVRTKKKKVKEREKEREESVLPFPVRPFVHGNRAFLYSAPSALFPRPFAAAFYELLSAVVRRRNELFSLPPFLSQLLTLASVQPQTHSLVAQSLRLS